MKLYAEIINEESKECIVINQVEAETLGWSKYDLEVGYNGKFYLEGYTPVQPVSELQTMFTNIVQDHLDSKAQERHYDDIFTAISYVNSSDPVFAAEASALLLWRDKVWRLCYTMLDDVKAGVRPIPSATELLAELPKFEWPEV